MRGDEVGIFSKVSEWQPLFLLKVKIKQNPGCPNNEYIYNAIFKHIHQNIWAFLKSKNYIDQWLWKYCCIFRTDRAKWGVGEQVWFIVNLFWGSEGRCNPRKAWLLLLSFKGTLMLIWKSPCMFVFI